MNIVDFIIAIKEIFPIGTIFDNPKKGQRRIASISNEKISHSPSKSTFQIYVKYEELFDAYIFFKGKKMSGPELKIYNSDVFLSKSGSNGHSCNCTFLMRVLYELELSSGFKGEGTRRKPFYIEVFT